MRQCQKTKGAFLFVLLHFKRVTVGTFNHSRVWLMRTNANLRKGTVILGVAVICALGNGTTNVFVWILFHCYHLAFFRGHDLLFVCRSDLYWITF